VHGPINIRLIILVFTLPKVILLLFYTLRQPTVMVHFKCHGTGGFSLATVTATNKRKWQNGLFNPLNEELNPICHLLVLLGAHPILHVSRIRVKRCRLAIKPDISFQNYPQFLWRPKYCRCVKHRPSVNHKMSPLNPLHHCTSYFLKEPHIHITLSPLIVTRNLAFCLYSVFTSFLSTGTNSDRFLEHH